MPGSSSRDALSMSISDLDFDHGSAQKRRAQNERSKRDLSKSCSAFNFVLDHSELGQAGGGDGEAKTRNRSKGRSKPSYSDMILDSAIKAITPGSVLIEEHSRLEFDGEASLSNTNHDKPTRSIPSSTDFNRNRTRNMKSKTNYEPDGALSPGGRARSNRLQRSSSAKFQRSFKIESDASEQEDFTPSRMPQRRRSSSRAKNIDHFSKSFSDFGHYEAPSELTATPTTRRLKIPTPALPRSRIDNVTSPSVSSKEGISELFSEGMDMVDNSQNEFKDSVTETDLLNGAWMKRSSQDSTGRKQSERLERLFRSSGDLDFSSHPDQPPPSPNRDRRRSIQTLELKTLVQTQKVSVEEFHAPANTGSVTEKPDQRARSRKDARERGVARHSSGIQLRRSQTISDTRPSRPNPEGARRSRGSSKEKTLEDSPAVLLVKGSRSSSKDRGVRPLRSTSQEKRTLRRRASVHAMTDLSTVDDGRPSGKKRLPRRTKSGDAPRPTTRPMRDRSSSGDKLPATRSVRRVKSTDGAALSPSMNQSTIQTRRSLARSTSTGHELRSPVFDKKMNQSMSVISGAEMSSPSMSSGDRSVIRARTSRENLSPHGTGKIQMPSNPRRKTPTRSKSDDGSRMMMSKRISKDRERSRDRDRSRDRERIGGGSNTKESEKAEKEERSSSTMREKRETELRQSRGARSGSAVTITKAERRAMVHTLLTEQAV